MAGIAAVAVVLAWSYAAVRIYTGMADDPPDALALMETLSRGKGELRPLRRRAKEGGASSAYYGDDDDDDEPHLGAKTTFLLGVFSTLTEKEKRRRALIRETYLSSEHSIPGLCSLPDYEARGPKFRSGCRIVYAFVVGANPRGPTERVREEDDADGGGGGGVLALNGASVEGSMAESDVVYLNIKENMENGKTPSWFGYGASLADKYSGDGGIDYIGKVDSDTQLNADQLIRIVRSDLPPAPYNRRTYGGRLLVDFPGSGSYMAGEFYFASTDLARYVTRDMTAEERHHLSKGIEDADFGACVESHPKPIKMVVVSNYIFWHHPLKADGYWKIMWNARKMFRPMRRERMVLIPDWMRYAVEWFG